MRRAASIAARVAARLEASACGGDAADALTPCAASSFARREALLFPGRRAVSTRPLSTSTQAAAGAADDPPSMSSSSSSWIPSWARARLPASLGGTPSEETDLTLDSYRKQIGRARKVAALGGAIGGAARASADPQAQGNLRLYEAIIDGMEPAHRADLSAFDAPARAKVAASVGASPAQVDDCIRKYEWTRAAMSAMAARKAAGAPLPTSMEELEAMVGRRGGGGSGGGASPTAACPFAGQAAPPGRNAVCPRTGKKWKNCCGGK